MTSEDAWVTAAASVEKMRSEISELRAKLAEHELLFGRAIEREDFLDKLLVGLGGHLPDGTPSTVDGIVDAVANMALKLDAHEDASTPALDEIAKLCGMPPWEYPGQVIRDVARVVEECYKLRERLRIAESTRNAAQAASNRDLELRREAAAVAATHKALNDTEVATLRARVAELEAGNHRDHMQQADDRKPGGPTLGGEDLSPDPEVRRAQIRAVVMGEPQPDITCACSSMYRKTLAPGVHAAYCPLKGQPLEPDPPSCKVCRDRGVVETGNNDFPCDCRAGDTAMFNSDGRMQTGAEIKARRR